MTTLEEVPGLGRLPVSKWQTDIVWSVGNSWKWQLDPGSGLKKNLLVERRGLVISPLYSGQLWRGFVCVYREQKFFFFQLLANSWELWDSIKLIAVSVAFTDSSFNQISFLNHFGFYFLFAPF